MTNIAINSCATDSETESSEKVGRSIPVRITKRGANDDQKNDGFTVYARRRTKRFCVLGLSSSVNTDVLKTVINKKGPTVTNIRVFTLRRSPGKIMLRVNGETDEHADLLLSDDFWPYYVT